MLQSHVAPGQFTGPVRTKIKESRRAVRTRTIFLKNFGPVRAPYSPWLKLNLHNFQTRAFYDILPVGDT